MKLHHFCRASDLNSIAKKGLYPHVAHEAIVSLGHEVVCTTTETTATSEEDVERYRRLGLWTVSLIVVSAVLALAETGSGDSFESLHEAARRSTQHIFQNRAHRVAAPSPQSASERRKGITTTQEDE